MVDYAGKAEEVIEGISKKVDGNKPSTQATVALAYAILALAQATNAQAGALEEQNKFPMHRKQ